jgi:hypothetical protein
MQTATVVTPKVSRAVSTVVTQIGGYSPAAATAAIVTSLVVTNTSAATRTVKVSLYDGTNDTYLAFNAPIAVGDSLMVGGANAKFTLTTGWSVRVVADAAQVDVSMCVTEFA